MNIKAVCILKLKEKNLTQETQLFQMKYMLLLIIGVLYSTMAVRSTVVTRSCDEREVDNLSKSDEKVIYVNFSTE